MNNKPWAISDFPILAEEPKIMVPEGIFLPTAVRLLADNGFTNDRDGYKKCAALISDWILTGQLPTFRIGMLCQQKEPVPEEHFRRPAIDNVFTDGQTEILKNDLPQGFETYWVYIDRKQFERLVFGKKGSFKKNLNKPTKETTDKIVAEIKNECRKNNQKISSMDLYRIANEKLFDSKVTTEWARAEFKNFPDDLRRKRGEHKNKKRKSSKL